MKGILSGAVKVVSFLAIFAFVLVLYSFPHYPSTVKGWLFLITIAIICETLSQTMLSRKVGEKISRKSFSLLRIVVAFSVVGVLLLAIWICVDYFDIK